MGQVVTTLVRYILVILLPVGVIAALNPHRFLLVLFGSQYANYPDSPLSFAILVLSYVVWGVVYGLHAVLRSMKEKAFFLATGVAVIVLEIIGSWYLISWFGLLGCAMIRCTYILVLLISSLARLHQKGVRNLSSISRSLLRIGVSSIIAGSIAFVLAPPGVLALVAVVSLSLLVYVLLLVVSGEPEQLDFQIAKSLLPRKIHWFIEKAESFNNR